MHFPILTGCFGFCLSFSLTKLIMPPQLLSNEFLFQAFIVPQTPPSPGNSQRIRCQVCLLKEHWLGCRKPMKWSPSVCPLDINNQELIIPENILSLQLSVILRVPKVSVLACLGSPMHLELSDICLCSHFQCSELHVLLCNTQTHLSWVQIKPHLFYQDFSWSPGTKWSLFLVLGSISHPRNKFFRALFVTISFITYYLPE